MKKNVGKLDAVLRISCGLIGLTWAATHSTKKFPAFIALISALKVAEGMTRYCLILQFLGKKSI
ncbi:DUF2892 domain-containing protein [Hazenella sp. IB182357]|uniref:DUF2892 domain-containing protein n=1 Tax=Polycladospora coralii TaxID=2771432 RepID=A0A926NBT8_9BACL|nr:DUF2892 domain-containing protein [Polycladospora coralii]MBD1373362.1 DUF2892 domain-containing protein [Polycladospora coralii]MBS7531639.1 DUF2892 domain-containing protein [Polycladospora coralii]